eukprot:NODE_1026_length_1754_cov_25.787097_g905_i0.p1 GENE.NODE_1026_length_1754_cov_25.787097_g905_i0~~NODE_1026_length_1754_cov_25.787097_g905_i0.p1  ORF type:complete len:510 (-),score=118.56 NODE_1026_length_1754_cov_25.787097_g905_i0:224-1573(-)
MQIERNRISRLQLQQRVLQEEAEKCPGTPRITHYAAQMQRPGTVGDRLYELWLSKMTLKNEAKGDDGPSSGCGMGDDDCTYTPAITRQASAMPRGASVFEDMLARHEYTRNLQTQQRADALWEEDVEAHRPLINPVSQEIAARLPETSTERLLRTPLREGRLNSGNMADDARTTRYARDSVSSSLGAATPSLERVESMYMKEERKKEKLERMRQRKEAGVMAECTFRPNTLRSRSLSPSSRHASTPLHERSMNWARRRDIKLEEERLRREALEVASCTFNPDTRCAGNFSLNSLNVAMESLDVPDLSHHQLSSDAADPNPWGFGEFVHRQQEARERKAAAQQRANSVSGKGWRNKVTVPQPFRLGSGHSTPIKALQRPIEGPRVPDPMPSRNDRHSDKENVWGAASTSTLERGAADEVTLPQRGVFSSWSSREIIGNASASRSTTPCYD